MTKSEHVQRLDEIQKALTPFLRGFGFRKKSRSYNRMGDEGLIQVINFQSGRYPIENHEIPDTSESLYGRFTVNLGILIPSVYQLEFNSQLKNFYQEYDCQIRTRLGALIQNGVDVWWGLDQSPHQVSSSLQENFLAFGFPFLYQFSSHEAIIHYHAEHGQLPFNPPGRSALLAGMIYHSLGEKRKAAALFNEAQKFAAEKQSHPGFEKYVQEIRARCFPRSKT